MDKMRGRVRGVDYLRGNGSDDVRPLSSPPMTSLQQSRPVGELLRGWRQRRGLSQMDLALRAEVSTRHVSFLETGRSQPSRDMLLHLAEELDVPLRDRNSLLVAAGFAPVF